MSLRSDRISQIPFQMPFHTCLTLPLSLSVLPLLSLAALVSWARPKTMPCTVLFCFCFSLLDLLLLFPTAIDLCAPPHEPIYHGAACTVRYISHPYPSGHEILRLLLALALSSGLSVSLLHLMAPPPGTINSTPDIIVGATQWQKPIQNL